MIDYEHELNAEQYEAVKTTEGPELILAVAGAGKTRTLIYRVAYLIEHGADPRKILLLTFTNKAAEEMKERASLMLDERCSYITACTYHSFCAKMLRRYHKEAGISKSFQILTQSDSADVIELIKDKMNIDIEKFPGGTVIGSIISASINKNRDLVEMIKTEDNYEMFRPFWREIKKISEKYKAYKKKHDMLDFDDLLTVFVGLLESNPEIRRHFDDSFQYIMVDEYQDSNALQDQMLTLMREHNKNIAVVGDDMQSLYGFRGADVGNILRFPQKWKGCKTITLYKNYRSAQEILDFTNCMVRNNLTEGIAKDMQGFRTSGMKPKIVQVSDDGVEAEYVMACIDYLVKSGKYRYSDIAVLSRTSFPFNSMELPFRQQKIPYVKYGGQKFMDKPRIRDITALWKCILNEKDEVSWYRILKLFPGIAGGYAQKISEHALEKGADILTDNGFDTHKFSQTLKDFRPDYDSFRKTAYPDVLKTTIDYYLRLCQETIRGSKKAEKTKKEELRALKKDVKSMQVFLDIADSYKSLGGFVEGVILDPPDSVNADDDNTVTLSTIHSAKGLEWPVVFVLQCADGLFPKNSAKPETIAEELRCMYVAVTRAKDRLYMMYPDNSESPYGKTRPASRFLLGTGYYADSIKYESRVPQVQQNFSANKWSHRGYYAEKQSYKAPVATIAAQA